MSKDRQLCSMENILSLLSRGKAKLITHPHSGNTPQSSSCLVSTSGKDKWTPSESHHNHAQNKPESAPLLHSKRQREWSTEEAESNHRETASKNEFKTIKSINSPFTDKFNEKDKSAQNIVNRNTCSSYDTLDTKRKKYDMITNVNSDIQTSLLTFENRNETSREVFSSNIADRYSSNITNNDDVLEKNCEAESYRSLISSLNLILRKRMKLNASLDHNSKKKFQAVNREYRRLNDLKKRWPRISIQCSAELSIADSKRIPLLMSQVQVVLHQFVASNSRSIARSWFVMKGPEHVPHIVLLLIDGVSSNTLGELSIDPDNAADEKRTKKLLKYHKKMLLDGEIQPYVGDYSSCYDDGGGSIDDDVSSNATTCGVSSSATAGGVSSNATTCGVISTTGSACNTGLQSWLPQSSSILGACVEVVPPSADGCSVVQDLFTVQLSKSAKMKIKKGQIARPVTRHRKYLERPMCREAAGNERSCTDVTRASNINDKRSSAKDIVLSMHLEDDILLDHFSGLCKNFNIASTITNKSHENRCKTDANMDDRHVSNNNTNAGEDCESMHSDITTDVEKRASSITVSKSRQWGKARNAENVSQLKTKDEFDRRKLLVTLQMMLELEYPMPQNLHDDCYKLDKNKKNYRQFVGTKAIYSEVTSSSPLFGLDCEFYPDQTPRMIAIVNESGEPVYNTYISSTAYPGNYDSADTLKQVRRHIARHLPSDAILVGHNINSDLQSLKVYHPYIIDSSVLYNINDGGYNNIKANGLKALSHHMLNITIQSGGKGGHDPTEDAWAALQLVQLKLNNSLQFGHVLLGGHDPDLTRQHQQLTDAKEMCQYYSMFERLTENNEKDDSDKNISIISTGEHEDEWLQSFRGLYNLGVKMRPKVMESNDKVVEQCCADARMCDVIIAHLQADIRLQSSKLRPRLSALASLDLQIKRVHSSLPTKSLLMVMFTGSSQHNGIIMFGIKGAEQLKTR